MRAQDVDVELIGANRRMVCRHCTKAFVPIRHRDRDAVRLRRRRQVLGRTRAREIERELHDSIDAFAGKNRFLKHDLALGALEHPSADRRIFPFGVLANDDEVDVAGFAICERRRDAGHQSARPQVHVLIEAPAKLDERAPQ